MAWECVWTVRCPAHVLTESFRKNLKIITKKKKKMNISDLTGCLHSAGPPGVRWVCQKWASALQCNKVRANEVTAASQCTAHTRAAFRVQANVHSLNNGHTCVQAHGCFVTQSINYAPTAVRVFRMCVRSYEPVVLNNDCFIATSARAYPSCSLPLLCMI
jgi:hypothetical protein